MDYKIVIAGLGAVALLAAIGLWSPFGTKPGPTGETAVWLIPMLALFIATLCVAALRSRARRWAKEQQRQLDRRSAQLEETRDAYQALINHSDLFIFTLDEKGRYLSMNRQCLTVLGACLQDIEGKYFEEHLNDRGAARLRELFQQALNDGQAKSNLEPMLLGGKERFLDISLKALEGPLKSQSKVLVMMRDQTDRKTLENRMWQTEKLASLGLLAAGVAHQINNPLGILMGFSQLLLESTPEGENGHRELGIILEQGAECKRIVDGLLNFTRLSELGSEQCDLLVGLSVVLDTTRPVLERLGIELELDLPASLPPCRAQGGAMQQVFLNLISNSMDAMPKGGRLMVSASQKNKEPRQGNLHGTLPESESYIEILFRDTGPGIDPEDLERIYDPFFTTKPVGQGTGLGLSVAYGIVKDHGGTLTTEQPVFGEDSRKAGACFIIRLPVGQDGTPGVRKKAGQGAPYES